MTKIEYPRKERRTILILDSPEVVEVLSFSPEEDNFMIMQEEMYRLANENRVVVDSLVESGCVEDNAYFSNGNYYQVPSIESWRKCIRFYATYKIIKDGTKIFYGSGSAGSDNVSSWMFKGSAYEIAHKRAQVNGIRKALNLFEYKVENIDIDSSSQNISPKQIKEPTYEEERKTEKDGGSSIQKMQVDALINIIFKSSNVGGAFNADNFEEFTRRVGIYDRYIEFTDNNEIYPYKSEEVLRNSLRSFIELNVTKEEAGKIITTFGNFSREVKKP